MKRSEKKIGVGGAVITPYAKKLVNRVLDSGRLSYGPFLRAFEEKFAELVERKFAISTNSGTSALQVALHAAKEVYGWRDGDEVLVPAITFVATANAIIQNDLKPIFVDVDPKTYLLNPKELSGHSTKRTRAIMPVHLFGTSCDMAPILSFARAHKLKVIEDSCESIGIAYKGKQVGALGDIACYSTYMAHIITTGVGGFATTNDPPLAIKMRSLVNHGRDSIYVAMDDDYGLRGKARFEMVSKRFLFDTVGYSYRLTELEGALGLAELKVLSKNIRTRNRYAAMLTKGFKPFTKYLQLPSWPKGAGHAFMMYPLVVKNGAPFTRDELVAWLEDWNVETRFLLPLINQPVYVRLFGNLEERYPIARFLNASGFYIGCHPEMKSQDVRYVIAVFRDFFKTKGILG